MTEEICQRIKILFNNVFYGIIEQLSREISGDISVVKENVKI